MKFTKLSEEEQKTVFEKVKSIFAEFKGLKTKTTEPLGDMFGTYNISAHIEHPAFTSGNALIALFDGITGKLKVYDKLQMQYGGLSLDQTSKELDVDEDKEEILNKIWQTQLVISTIKELPMDIRSRESRGEQN